MSEYKEWSKQLWDVIEKLQRDNIGYEDMINGLATALQSGTQIVCDDCEWYNNCDNCDKRMPDEPRYNEGYE